MAFLNQKENPSNKETADHISIRNRGGWVGLIVSLGIFVFFILVEVDSLLENARNDSVISLFPVKSRCEYIQIPENSLSCPICVCVLSEVCMNH